MPSSTMKEDMYMPSEECHSSLSSSSLIIEHNLGKRTKASLYRGRLSRRMISMLALTFLVIFLLSTKGHKKAYSRLSTLTQCPTSKVAHSPCISTRPSHIVAAQGQLLAPGSTEKIFSDGSYRFVHVGNVTDPSLLVLTMVFNETSWAQTYDLSRNRTEDDHFDLLSRQMDLSQTALGLMTASKDLYDKLKKAVVERDIARATVLYRNDTKTYSTEEGDGAKSQYERRANVSSLRNMLMIRALEDEKHIFWLDADVIDMTPNLVNTMLDKADANPQEVGLMTARCDSITVKDLDKDAWGLDRTVEGVLLSVSEEKRDHYWHRMMDTRRYITEQTRGLIGDQLAKLDSIGTSSIYINADLVRRGVNFPPFKVVGTTWGRDGWTGQDTEGICYVAKHVANAGCWSLSDAHYTTHSS